ncbi:MAG: phosphodiester glycosidase family protein [Clostridia bacterium]|nr:phosphodiester glycosidase family protein [Clostridia bacterium]
MIRRLGVLAILALALLCAGLGAAAEAPDLTAECSFKTSSTDYVTRALYNRDFTNKPWKAKTVRHPYVSATAPGGEKIYGVYVCFATLPDSYVLQVGMGGDSWETIGEGSADFHHMYFEVPGGASRVRIYCPGDAKTDFSIHELYLFGQGEIPDWVQRWEPSLDKADILFFAAHPDDDLIFFGGGIPTYAAERGLKVAVAYLSYSNIARRSELLNALWALGVRNYPYIGTFRDNYSSGKINNWYRSIGGEAKVLGWITGVLRACRPEVVVSQDVNGEYGHPQHKLLADAIQKAYDLSSDASYTGAGDLAPWPIKKLYLHLWKENQIQMDWSVPLTAFGGKTGLEMADWAYTTYHLTQRTSGMSVTETGSKYDNTRFGLVRTEVGPDEKKNDFLEHIPVDGAEMPAADTGEKPDTDEKIAEDIEDPAEAEDAEDVEDIEDVEDVEDVEDAEDTADAEDAEGAPDTAEPVEDEADTAEPEAQDASPFAPWTPDPEIAERLPALNAKGYIDEGEFILADDTNGWYVYISQTLRIVIRRTVEQFNPKGQTYVFTADVWCDVEAGELPHTVFVNPDKPKSAHDYIRNTAKANQVVFATSTDYYTYRIKQPYATGIEVRGGVIFFDEPRKNPPHMPNYDTLAFYRDGHIESWQSTEKSAGEYIKEGAYDVYCFGPCLIKNGELTEYVATANESFNPRYAFGIVEPGHYVGILCEGRLARSKGIQMAQLAQLLLDHGCTCAVNLDGGQTAVFCFMGQQLNQVDPALPKGRAQAELLGFGTSEQVGQVHFE